MSLSVLHTTNGNIAITNGEEISTIRINLNISSAAQRLESIENRGYTGVHPILEKNQQALEGMGKQFKSLSLDVMQIASVLGENACFIIFNDDGAVDRELSIASNITSDLILDYIADQGSMSVAIKNVNNWNQSLTESKLCILSKKICDVYERKNIHALSGDLADAGNGSPIGDLRSKVKQMELFARLNNSGEDIGKIARDCVKQYQTSLFNNFVCESEVGEL